MFRNQLMGSLTDVYTATQYTNGLTPLVGDWYYDEALKAKFIFLKNSGASAITANLVAVALTTDKSSFFCSLAAGNTNSSPFAGARVTGATSLTQGTYGWFQISGPATLTADAAGTTAEQMVVTSNATAGNVETQPANTAGLLGPALAFAVAETTTTGATVKCNIVSNIWGL